MNTTTTLSEARTFILSGMEQPGGVVCPCCEQKVKLYHRILSSSMTRMLMALSSFKFGQYVHITDWRSRAKRYGFAAGTICGDYGKLEYWGFTEAPPGTNITSKNTKGLWRITQKGIDFLNNTITVPSHALVYNSEVIGFSTDMVNVKDALSAEFSYDELMG